MFSHLDATLGRPTEKGKIGAVDTVEFKSLFERYAKKKINNCQPLDPKLLGFAVWSRVPAIAPVSNKLAIKGCFHSHNIWISKVIQAVSVVIYIIKSGVCLFVTPIYSRSLARKNTKHFVNYIYFCLWLGVLKSRISEKFGKPLQSYLLTDQADSAKKAGLGRAS